ncbi:MAG TPA: sigma-70 family RNA polymerase sigma factor [Microbacteriaceae bacterium]|jgi:RNA polymerase sigma-70 factor (ECF subfamily)|nr:sigma-70 family RNA polymerase sigma factor [Microbacteriaceae bacterium]
MGRHVSTKACDERALRSIREVVDEQAAEVWRRQYEAIFRFVSRRASSRQEAEDLTQEVFEDAVAALAAARIDATSPPLAWLYTVARRRLIDRLRARALPLMALDEDALLVADTDKPYGPTLVAAILDALDQLNDEQRAVVVMKLFEGRSFVEIAAMVGASEEACRMRLSRGLARVRAELELRGVNP